MFDSSENCQPLNNENNYKEIEDIIDARKKLGHYNVGKQLTKPIINYRHAYSSSSSSAVEVIETSDSKLTRRDDTMIINEGDCNNHRNAMLMIRSDSELSLVSMKGGDGCFRRHPSNWNMLHDIAIPGDGSHLAESPSMVNLATFVRGPQNVPCEGDEYLLVPLSCWDPYQNTTTTANDTDNDYCSNIILADGGAISVVKQLDRDNITVVDNNIKSQDDDINELSRISSTAVGGIAVIKHGRRMNFAGRISKFIRKHWRKTKTLPEEITKDETMTF